MHTAHIGLAAAIRLLRIATLHCIYGHMVDRKAQKMLPQVHFSQQVGWWDAASECWSTHGISDVAMSGLALTFKSTHLGHLSLLVPHYLPYGSWGLRPTPTSTIGPMALDLETGAVAGS